jgi:prevent-host-death family protein
MCYVVYTMTTETVGIRELRQNLSRYLRRVRKGESIQVLDRGRPVALLTPLPGRSDAVGRLEAAGRLQRARRDLLELGPPPERPVRTPISEALLEERREP